MRGRRLASGWAGAWAAPGGLGIGVVVAAVSVEGAAHAELREAVQRLAEAWRAVGASVVVDKSRFLGDGHDDPHPISIALPDLPEAECTTIVVLGARGLGFHVRDDDGATGQVHSARAGADSGEAEPKRIPSVAGAVAIETCGEGVSPRRFVISSDSGRGAIEAVFARSSKPLPSLRSVLPERTGGVLAPAAEPGALPVLAAPEKRAELAEQRAKRDGATMATRATWQAGADGTGTGEETLDAGCHSLRLFAPDPRASHPMRRGKLDLDAEMRDREADRVLARDRSDAPDAQLAVCVGESTPVEVVFAGSPPGASVLVAHFGWPLPEHLPAVWGSEARGRLARALLARHVVSLPRDPVALAQGGSGLTRLPLTIEPGACYLAVTTLVRESARAIGLRVHTGATVAFDDRGIDDDGAAVAFCAGEQEHALAEVEARGNALTGWGFALYRLQAGVWEGAP